LRTTLQNILKNMTGNITPDQIPLVKIQYDGAQTISDSPELRPLLDLISRVKSLPINPIKTKKSRNTSAPINRLPVIIIAGDTATFTKKTLSKYRSLIIEAFHDFSGTIISCGTTAGVCGLVADIQEIHNDTIESIGYVPTKIPGTAQIDPRYKKIRRTDGKKFSVKEPLQYWTDILTSGISPAKVKLIGINGGNISGAEYRIALLLGANVGIIQDCGRAAADLLADKNWNTRKNLIVLPHDKATLRAVIGTGAVFPGNREREDLAQRIHEEYRKKQFAISVTDPENPSLVPWKNLDLPLKNSNRNQADHAFAKLKETGYRLRKAKRANPRIALFSPEEIEYLAELEHGRWNAERLLAGWKYGPVKDVTNKISPFIIPWSSLPEDMREWDRDPVRKLPEILAKMGYEMYRKTPGKNKRSA
jgi:hypothetical protein